MLEQRVNDRVERLSVDGVQFGLVWFLGQCRFLWLSRAYHKQFRRAYSSARPKNLGRAFRAPKGSPPRLLAAWWRGAGAGRRLGTAPARRRCRAARRRFPRRRPTTLDCWDWSCTLPVLTMGCVGRVTGDRRASL